MGAVALLLNIRLSKPGVYTLHANGSQVESQHIGMAVRLCERAICAWFVCVGLLLMLAAWY
jgi:adenosylcobinamide-phosphate synthase